VEKIYGQHNSKRNKNGFSKRKGIVQKTIEQRAKLSSM
jgi:hypothetical protein